ncbi:hypothetical protein E3E12_04085 [Formicincola oecophyllae]|uniref:Glycerophosphotransferase n=1 Tax=Formicincola oecophyllae TaxID=2558361 RepID=A0A4Y6UAU4_9PROT|nr:hypothetical protein [Formicincola oecophyllae]QDH13511.1 hypothetical protein E3E12_04085 [Formicincola oecophyllae]
MKSDTTQSFSRPAKPWRIAVLYIAEPYHCYHLAPLASALAARADCTVTEFVNFDACLPHIQRIRAKLRQPELPRAPLRRPMAARLLEATRLLDKQREAILRANVSTLEPYDAIVTTEYPAALLRQAGLRHPKLIYLTHGSGERRVGDEHLLKHFDLALVSGPKTVNYFLREGICKAGQIKDIGLPKFDLAGPHLQNAQLKTPARARAPQNILYNPHYKKKLSAWPRALKALHSAFMATRRDGQELLIAPHVKMFDESWGLLKRRFQKLASDHVHVDTGSVAALDMTNAAQADIYVGDVSSQFYEFLHTPKPCVFLNLNRLPWRDNPYFRNWTLGDVVEDPDAIMDAINAAPARHHLYKAQQEEMLQETFGPWPLLGASERGASTICTFLKATRQG